MKKRKIISVTLTIAMMLTLVLMLFSGTALAEVTFTNITSMNTVRGYYPIAATLDSDRILVMGGMPTSTTDTATCEIYTISTNSWSSAADMPIKRRWNMLNAAVLSDGKVLIAGGDLYGDGGTGLANIDIYDPSTNTWDTSGGEDPHNAGVYSAAYLPGNVKLAWPTATTMADGKVLIAGGRIGGTAQRKCWIFDPSDKSFDAIADMNYTHSAHGATLLNDGRVMVTGGEGSSSRTKTAEIYDPDTDTWTNIPDFPVMSGTTGKVGMVLVTLEDGRVMMMGGNSGAMGSDGADTQTSYYYPDSNTWVEGPDMASFSKSRAAYAMADGIVYVFGGGDGTSSYYNTCFKVEVYEPTLQPSTGLTISPGTLSPGYHEDTIFYTAENGVVDTFPNSQETMNFTPSSTEPNLKDIKVDGVVTASGAIAVVNLDTGMNEVYVDVTDTDDITRRYTIDVTREGSPPATKTVLEDCAPTKMLGVNGLTISSPNTVTPGVGTLTVTTADADSDFDDILYTPQSGYSGSFTVTYTTDTGAKTLDVTVTETHDVRFEQDDFSEIETRTIVDGQPVSSDGGAVSDPSKLNHSFDNWDSAQAGDDYSSAAASSYVPTGDTTFTADYSIDQHTIVTNENGGTAVPNLIRDYNGTINEVDVGVTTRDGYDFDAWYEDNVTFNTAVIFPHTVVADDIWYVNWNRIDYNITYHLNSGDDNGGNPATYHVETPTIALADGNRADYDFGGWYTDAGLTPGNEITEIPLGSTGDIEMWADWDPESYDITYNLDGGTNDAGNPAAYTKASATITFDDPGKAGYTFEGWFTNAGCTAGSEITEIPSGSTGDVEVWAKWAAKDYSITYNLDGGTNDVANPAAYTVETATITFADAEKTGYTFGGWYTDSGCTTGNEMTQIVQGSTGDVEVWAKWTPIDYTITYNLDGGTNHANNPAAYTIESTLILLAEPQRDGYLFEGWFTTAAFTAGSEISEIPSGSTGDVEVWVKWAQINAESEGYGTVKGNISTNGQGQAGVAVTLKSNPRTTFTDEDGNFQFENVPFDDHELVITNSAGTQIGAYDLDFTKGNETVVVINGAVADITYENNAVTVHLDISMNGDGTGTTLDEVTVISNPDTYGEARQHSWLIWAGIALIGLVVLIGTMLLVAIMRGRRAEA